MALVPLLLTKTNIPEGREDWVPRPSLMARLDLAQNHPLTVITAPAGYGKTALLTQWIQTSSQGKDAPGFGWVTLDENDNDPIRFWSYFVQALRACTGLDTTGASFLETLQPLQATGIEQVLPLLLNELARCRKEIILILDDFQNVDSVQVQNSLGFMIDHSPTNLHVLIAGRSDPLLPLSRYRARRQLLEFHIQDLRFNAAEITQFFTRCAGMDLNEEDLSLVNRKTEGWIAGMQLAVLSLEGQENKLGYLRSFSGDDPYILDFLADEILVRQPPVVQQFLLKTSILERLCPPLCELVVGQNGEDGSLQTRDLLYEIQPQGASAEAILAYLERSNLFLLALDQHRSWYRYHPLFAGLLQARLQKQVSPREVNRLHQQAARWFAGHEMPLEAFSHARAAGDFDLAIQLYNDHMPGMVERGELATMLSWLNAFSEDQICEHAELCLGYAWGYIYQVKFDLAEVWAQRALNCKERQPLSDFILGQVNTVRATVAINQDDNQKSIFLSRQALAQLPARSPLMHGLLYLNLGDASSRQDDFPAAVEAFQNALDAVRSGGNHMLEAVVIGSLGDIYLRYGQLRQGEAVLQQALALEKQSNQKLPSCGKALVFLSRVYNEWNQLPQAEAYALQSIDYCREWGHMEHLMDAYLNLAEVYRSKGRWDAARDTLAQARQLLSSLAREKKNRRVKNYRWWIDRNEAMLNLREGKWAEANLWLDQNGIQPGVSFTIHTFNPACMRAEAWLAQGMVNQAGAMLESLATLARQKGWLAHEIEALTLLALVRQQAGDITPAVETLKMSLRLAQPEGFMRVFLKHGPPMKTAISTCLSQQEPQLSGLQPDERLAGYAASILAAFDPKYKTLEATPEGETPSRSINGGRETLSDREMEILRLVAAGLSNDEIASTLILSTNTIKTHLKRIFAKLNTSGRLETVNRARQLNLI